MLVATLDRLLLPSAMRDVRSLRFPAVGVEPSASGSPLRIGCGSALSINWPPEPEALEFSGLGDIGVAVPDSAGEFKFILFLRWVDQSPCIVRLSEFVPYLSFINEPIGN